MEWNVLTSESQWKQILGKSKEKPQVVFKHSTRCSISKTVWNRLERTKDIAEDADFYYLDLIAYREISNMIAEDLKIDHESPQIFVIKNGDAVYNADHFEITVDDLCDQFA